MAIFKDDMEYYLVNKGFYKTMFGMQMERAFANGTITLYYNQHNKVIGELVVDKPYFICKAKINKPLDVNYSELFASINNVINTNLHQPIKMEELLEEELYGYGIVKN